jgi:hypothetical protein
MAHSTTGGYGALIASRASAIREVRFAWNAAGAVPANWSLAPSMMAIRSGDTAATAAGQLEAEGGPAAVQSDVFHP